VKPIVQVSLDLTDIKEAMEMAHTAMRAGVDWLEAGTPFILAEGLHGVIGKGLNDYDAIFKTLKDVGFDSWISIEDGVDGMEQMHESADFLREKIKKYWPNYQPR